MLKDFTLCGGLYLMERKTVWRVMWLLPNDGTVYIQNPMTFFPTNSWIKGHKTIGDTIAVELPQLIYVNDNDVNYYAHE